MREGVSSDYLRAVCPTAIARKPTLGQQAGLFLLRGYQRWVSPFLAVLVGSGCRFHPTCSEYSAQAVGKYGLWRGGLLTLRRLLRCHPFHPGGLDPLR